MIQLKTESRASFVLGNPDTAELISDSGNLVPNQKQLGLGETSMCFPVARPSFHVLSG